MGHKEAFTAVLDGLAKPRLLLREQAKTWLPTRGETEGKLGFQCVLMC